MLKKALKLTFWLLFLSIIVRLFFLNYYYGIRRKNYEDTLKLRFITTPEEIEEFHQERRQWLESEEYRQWYKQTLGISDDEELELLENDPNKWAEERIEKLY